MMSVFCESFLDLQFVGLLWQEHTFQGNGLVIFFGKKKSLNSQNRIHVLSSKIELQE